MTNKTNICVPEEIKNMQEQEIHITEIAKAIYQLPRSKTPGCDGIPIDFYKMFFRQISPMYMDLVRAISVTQKMNESASLGVLNLIPKAKKDMQYLKFLRPITLLNSDGKILEKVMANRMGPAMDAIIHTNQKGFLPGRRISANIREIFDLIKYAKEKELEALILSLDFLKCFDMIEFVAIEGALRYFGFGEELVRWINILYADFQVIIQNNGHFSKRVDIKRGVHQGGPASSLILLCCAELLAINIRKKEQIQGIPVKEIIHLLGQYADDADLYLKNNQDSLNAVFDVLERFKNSSGFTVNYDKTSIYRIGSLENSQAKLYSEKQINWTNDPINVLGIWVTHEGNEEQLNYDDLLEKTKNILYSWRNRSLSLIGKVTVVNTLVASLMVYKMMVLPTISEKLNNMLENEVENFLWNGKRAKIKLSVLQLDNKDGGLKLVHFKKRDMALKATWIQILKDDEEMAAIAYQSLIQELIDDIWRCNLKSEDAKHFVQKGFWHDVLVSWCKFNFKSLTDVKENQIIWCNSLIRIGKHPVFREKAFQKGLRFISDLYPENVVDQDLMQKYGLNWMELSSLKHAIPKELKTAAKNEQFSSMYDQMVNTENISRKVYLKLIEDENYISKLATKWDKEPTVGMTENIL